MLGLTAARTLRSLTTRHRELGLDADGFQAGGARPTGLAVAKDGALLVADDARGRIYRIAYTGK